METASLNLKELVGKYKIIGLLGRKVHDILEFMIIKSLRR